MRRRPWDGLALLMGIVVASWLITRFGRGFGLFGLYELVVPLLVILILLALARAWTSNAASPRAAGRRPLPKNVTPVVPVIETVESKLRALDRLHADGILSDTEYEAERAQLTADS